MDEPLPRPLDDDVERIRSCVHPDERSNHPSGRTSRASDTRRPARINAAQATGGGSAISDS
ncbi:MAG: hypothetical protein RBS39_09655, partial [Phycisphaerales bacterium]|nr:hypothetical protein [Phycisphaerales bacterium]